MQFCNLKAFLGNKILNMYVEYFALLSLYFIHICRFLVRKRQFPLQSINEWNNGSKVVLILYMEVNNYKVTKLGGAEVRGGGNLKKMHIIYF